MINLPSFSAHMLLQELRESGASLRVDEAGRLLVTFGEIVSTPALVADIGKHRADLIRMLTEEMAPKPETAGPFGAKLKAQQERQERDRVAHTEARRLLVGLRAAGHTVKLSGEGRITISPRPAPDIAERCIAAKPILVGILSRERAEAEAAS